MPSFSGNDIESKHYANIINQALQKEKYKGVIMILEIMLEEIWDL